MPLSPRLIVLPLLFWFGAFARADDSRLAEREAQFEREIRPVLIAECIKCHGPKKQEGGLRLDTKASLFQGGDSGPSIDVDALDQSLILSAIRHDGLEMPPGRKLPDKTITRFERWVQGGAAWPESLHELRESDGNVTEQDRSWWAFQPIRKGDAPKDSNDQWSANEIDRFVWSALQSQAMQPAPQADKTTLIRRLYFDLIGLPPSPQEIDAFVRDPDPKAFEMKVDQLLEDPRYGEHWARFWLDLVRYSESDGWNQDAYRPHLWRYRDYVVQAFNEDMPYPKFVMDQLAGDESETEDPKAWTAAGFLRLGVYEYNQRDARGQWNDIMNEMTDVAGDVFLGMSLSCARCHQHKFDPIPQRDYFKFRAFFEPVCWRDDIVAATEAEKAEHRQKMEAWEKATETIQKELQTLLEPYEKKKWVSTVDKFPLDIQACFHLPTQDRTSWQEQMAYLVSRQYLEEGGGPYKGMKKEDTAKHEALLKDLAAHDALKPKPLPEIMTVRDFPGILSPTTIPEDSKRQPVEPGFLEVLSQVVDPPSVQRDGVREGSSGRRTALAKWIADPRNPLTNRVIVNRIWQQHFGQGIVSTSSDFGHLGDAPTHPELLDWLTSTFIEEGWKFKSLSRRIVLSNTWKQSARHPSSGEYQSKDPGERLLWRTRVRRLQAEQIRDAMLVASGELQSDIGGPSVAEDKPRRSLYLKSFRNQNDTFVHGFDVANGLQSVAVRDTTTTPTQSLLLLNGKYALQRAKKLSDRLLAHSQDPQDVLYGAFLSTWGRGPTPGELERAREFIGISSGEDAKIVDAVKLADFCHVLFNSNPFLYLE